MAGNGPAPQATHSRERDTKRRVTDRQITVTRSAPVATPTLEEATGRDDWGVQATAYWQTWATSPQSDVFEATDWQRLAMLIPLVESYWAIDADKGLLAEIRINEERLGATLADRMKLRMKIEAAELASVSPIGGGASDEELLA